MNQVTELGKARVAKKRRGLGWCRRYLERLKDYYGKESARAAVLPWGVPGLWALPEKELGSLKKLSEFAPEDLWKMWKRGPEADGQYHLRLVWL